MEAKHVVLSKRLKMLADMVTPGNRVADVGCDHGYLSIYLIQKGISPSALAMDVRKGPLSAAKDHIARYGLDGYIKTRLSDGLLAYREGEADTIVCAGMGGRLMEKILTDSLEKVKSAKELILQPQSELGAFRSFLMKNGFRIDGENGVYEDGKYYFAMRAAYVGVETKEPCPAVMCEFGPGLLSEKNPVLKEYLLFRKQVLSDLCRNLSGERTQKTAARLAEINGEVNLVNEALAFFAEDE